MDRMKLCRWWRRVLTLKVEPTAPNFGTDFIAKFLNLDNVIHKINTTTSIVNLCAFDFILFQEKKKFGSHAFTM